MMQSLLIGGRWLEGDRVSDIRSPWDAKVAGTIARATAAQAIEAAALAQAYRSPLTAFERAGILARTADRVEAEAADFARSIVAESGLALKEAGREVARAVTQLRVCAEEAKRITGESMETDVTSSNGPNIAFTLREPVGLVCAITPFNRPLNQVVVKLGPAIAANCSVILKPSEKTPLTALRFVRTLIECGLPPEMVSVVTGDPAEIGDALVTCPHVDMVTFTGSGAVGEHIARKAGMIRTAFELGDSGALMVMEDADLAAAVKVAAPGAFATSGQSCRGIKRLLVHEAVADAFAAALAAEAGRMKVGDPWDPQTDMGTVINEGAALEIERRVADAVSGGAKVAYGHRREGAQYWPTVIDHVDHTAPLVQAETFGPCAPIIRVRDFEHALELANATPYGLQTGLFTRDIGRAMTAIRSLRTGAVIINGGPQFEAPNIPFGGVKKSGLGREGVKYAIQEMTIVKTVVLP
ncbi:putative NAD-dependent aldehyde dehydrogenase [Magnetospirillum sp. XM-1]|uniref:aldehyde dehydrogenase family protein n=1 Tax=Magnetospirillum sp. XM-1 TaxID=1663591 RepID=UPI00073DFB7F|nr:aldehyde dehydrogenase family protein [Magnetospirillum sp. XM-1]CUW38008.1 putative NAD-dependent aldehyde dehydrogenase [Magnetospirillum sp. XM-1]